MMPLDKFVLILTIVIAAAGASIWVLALLFTSIQLSPFGLLVLIPIGLAAYVIARVVGDRIGNKDDDYYDGIEK